MTELSQVVRQRLASRGAAGDHPDADTLTAYTEQLLPTGERIRVLEHIAACANCREIVALSLPEAAESLPAAAVGVAKRWRWKPALGFAASLATLALVATLLVELPRKPATFDSAQQSAAPAKPAEADRTAAPTTQPEAVTAGGVTEKPNVVSSGSMPAASGPAANARNNDVTVRTAMPPPPVPSASAASAKPSSSPVVEARLNERDYVNKQMFDAAQQGNDDIPSVADIPSAPLPRTLAQNQFPPPLTSNVPLTFADLPPQVQNGKVVRSRQFSNLPNNHFGLGLIPNLPALGRKAETLARRSLAIQPGALTFSTMESKSLNPSREDQVQSVDANDKTAAGELDQSSAFSYRALAGAPATAAWKVAGGSLLKSADATTWNAGYGPADIEFTVVAARGANVWAGGTNAALVHSTNNGMSWERVTLGASATGSITSIELAGANVHVKSSSGQEWSSQDGGKTWAMDK